MSSADTVHISRIELENIKSYASAAFDFARGTTAITGENGAGKTTIIESIAWVLFDLLEYKKDDFVRRGEKKGSARLTLVSGLDEREYIIFRDTAAGYNVTNPQLAVRIADKKEEVTRFLWQHLGLEPGTDLRSLFRQAIGVPQGTFTAIFLEGYAERKAAFDRLLKVEEYRQAAENLLETSRYLDASISGIRETIARSEGELGRTEVVSGENARVTSEIEALTRESESVSRDVAKSRTDEASLASAAAKYHEAKSTADRTRSDHESARLVFDQSERDTKHAERAAELIATVTDAAEKHLDANNRLKSLDADRSKRDALRANKTEVEKRLITASAEAVRLNERLDRSIAAETEIEKLAPKIAEQEILEAKLAAVRERLERARLAASRLSDRRARIERVRIEYKENQDKLRSAEQKSTLALSVSLIERDDVAIGTQLADLRAELETDE
ncbi:MAG: SMC family ATPase, partial [Blastocatellia bacterium]|nr:SMC family ATPase [Blastocatellia bacterium]